jgi:hypothetical protein
MTYRNCRRKCLPLRFGIGNIIRWKKKRKVGTYFPTPGANKRSEVMSHLAETSSLQSVGDKGVVNDRFMSVLQPLRIIREREYCC